jgi:parallel beta-helix repeat protein
MAYPYNVISAGDDAVIAHLNDTTKALGRVDDVGLYPLKASRYVVYPISSTYYVFDGVSGKVVSSGTDSGTEITWAMNNLTAGRARKERVTLLGDFAGVSGPIAIPSYTILDMYQAKLTLANTVNDNLFEADGKLEIDVFGGKLNGNKANQTSTPCDGIRFTDCDDVRIRDVWAYDFYWVGIGVSSASKRAWIERCKTIDNEKFGIWVSGDDMHVLNNYVSGTVQDNNIDCFKVDRGEIRGNTVLNAAANHGIGLYDVGGYVTVTNNYCGGNAKNGIYVDDNGAVLKSLVITGNTCKSNTESGIRVTEDTDTKKLTTIANNILESNTLFGLNVWGEYMTLTGNVAYNNGDSGIRLYSSEYCTVTGNICVDDQGTETQDYGIEEDAGCNNNRFASNVVDGYQTGGFALIGVNTLLDEHFQVDQDIDLSGGAVDYDIFMATTSMWLAGYDIVYTEASSADVDWPADAVRIGRTQDGVALDDDYFDETVTEASKNLGYRKSFVTSDMTNSLVAAGDTVSVGTGGGKTGTGAVRVILKLLQNVTA